MTSKLKRVVVSIIICALGSGWALAQVCQGFGPQAPRDIDNPAGQNLGIFSIAPAYRQMNLCNLHFHKQAEHRAQDFSLSAGLGSYGGYRCNATDRLTLAELQPLRENHCTNVAPGDTIEVHWVYSSCDVAPGEDLESCLSESCLNPDLRAETQVFLLVNDPSANDFTRMDYGGLVNGYHQAKSLPSDSGQPIQYLGSTTGGDFSDEACSPLQVSWSVRPRCAKLDIGSLSRWCQGNIFKEDRGHSVRRLVTNLSLLSRIE